MSGILVTLALGGTFLLGAIVVVLFRSKGESIEEKSISLAFGALVAIAALDLFPEVFLEAKGMELLWSLLSVVAGVIVLKALDHFIPEHEDEGDREGNLAHIGIMAAMALVIHNVVEGMTVASVTATSLRAGLSLAVGVGLHNIPMGMFIYSAVGHEEKAKRHLILLVSMFSTLIGGIAMAFLRPIIGEVFVLVLTGFALGMVVYILFFELLPSFLGGKRDKASYLFIALGFLLVLAATLFE